jgi:hypothetical protein
MITVGTSVREKGVVAKGDRNRQQARAKLAQMRALEARRRRRRRWLAGTGAVVVTWPSGL